MNKKIKISRDELADALDGLLIGSEIGGVLVRDPVQFADALFARAERQREPEYERGQFYQDALNRVFFRLLGSGDGWSEMPEGKPYRNDYPQRPLRKLVPEQEVA